MTYRDAAPALWARIDVLERERARLQVKLERLSQRRRRQVRRRIAIWTLVAATSITLGWAAVRWYEHPRFMSHGYVPANSASVSVRSIHAVAEAWLANHEYACPTVDGLLRDKELAPSSDPHDPWGQPYVITCIGDDVSVTSSGPDRVLHTPDDVTVPAPKPDPDLGPRGAVLPFLDGR